MNEINKWLNILYELLTLELREEAMKIMNRNTDKYKTKAYIKINLILRIRDKKIVMKINITVAEPNVNQNNSKIVDQNVVLYSLISESIESNVLIICLIFKILFFLIICEILL